ncbi:hypothetical protein BpHYR1_039839 [Brachionus plicatilis]|uniref:Uncharacterized protein n=1 Tax=Brachionus plicatilis TaxID=10195 RepID=A0A3M7S9E1_BRAPC|nr:hypothetical protein BpHYR1_039839 [Brachionus plicatilis]
MGPGISDTAKCTTSPSLEPTATVFPFGLISKQRIWYSQGRTLRAIQNNLNRYDDWLSVWREGMWDDECSS